MGAAASVPLFLSLCRRGFYWNQSDRESCPWLPGKLSPERAPEEERKLRPRRLLCTGAVSFRRYAGRRANMARPIMKMANRFGPIFLCSRECVQGVCKRV